MLRNSYDNAAVTSENQSSVASEKDSNTQHENSQQRRQTENLAWASVQIQCLCQWVGSSGQGTDRKPFTSASNIDVVTDPLRSKTSLSLGTAEGVATRGGLAGNSGNIQEFACTPPKILFCDLYILPGEARNFSYEDTIPSEGPSTYHGKNIRFYYRLVIAAQRVGCPIATLRLPIRVLSPFNRGPLMNQGANGPVVDDTAFGYHACGREKNGILGANNKPAITNPFATHSEGSDFGSDDVPGHHEDEEDPDGLLSSKMALLLHEPAPMIAARRKATHYDIRATEGRRVGKLCLFKTAYKLGEDILGLFDFSDVDLSCLQYSVSLIGEEKLPADGKGLEKTDKNNVGLKGDNKQSGGGKPEESTNTTFVTKLISKQSHQEFCFGFEETSFALAVPLHVTPSFKLPECELTWMLRFEFVISASKSSLESSPKSEQIIKRQPYIGEYLHDDVTAMGHEWNGPSRIEVETMTWNLPIILLPAHPQIVASAVSSTLKCSMTM